MLSGWKSTLKSTQHFMAAAVSSIASYGVIPARFTGHQPALTLIGTRSGSRNSQQAISRSQRALYAASASGLSNGISGVPPLVDAPGALLVGGHVCPGFFRHLVFSPTR